MVPLDCNKCAANNIYTGYRGFVGEMRKYRGNKMHNEVVGQRLDRYTFFRRDVRLWFGLVWVAGIRGRDPFWLIYRVTKV